MEWLAGPWELAEGPTGTSMTEDGPPEERGNVETMNEENSIPHFYSSIYIQSKTASYENPNSVYGSFQSKSLRLTH